MEKVDGSKALWLPTQPRLFTFFSPGDIQLSFRSVISDFNKAERKDIAELHQLDLVIAVT